MNPVVAVPEPASGADTAELLARYLDYYRESVIAKLDGIGHRGLRAQLLPSGWTPIELLAHLVQMERRWFFWGFLGEPPGHRAGVDRRADRGVNVRGLGPRS